MLATGAVMSIHAAAERCLAEPNPAQKLRLSAQVWEGWQQGRFGRAPVAVHRYETPGRPALPQLVPANQLKPRRLGSPLGRATLLHAVAHIEFNAINLAWDAVYRFQEMPDAFVTDWVSVAADEARHFAAVQQRLQDLGYDYGQFPAHNGLWQMALDTAHCVRTRMALVPRVLEARGLDVTPGMMVRLEQVGDQASVDLLAMILREEVRHVDVGSAWFKYCCAQDGREPDSEFLRLLQVAGTHIKLPLNERARLAAGFSAVELASLQAIGV